MRILVTNHNSIGEMQVLLEQLLPTLLFCKIDSQEDASPNHYNVNVLKFMVSSYLPYKLFPLLKWLLVPFTG